MEGVSERGQPAGYINKHGRGLPDPAPCVRADWRGCGFDREGLFAPAADSRGRAAAWRLGHITARPVGASPVITRRECRSMAQFADSHKLSLAHQVFFFWFGRARSIYGLFQGEQAGGCLF